MTVNKKDKYILRELGEKTAEIAAQPIQTELRNMWKALNSLKPIRPMFTVSEIPWHEMDIDEELKLQCEDEFCRSMEMDLRRRIYKSKYIKDDTVINANINIPKAINGLNYGIKQKENISVTDPNSGIVGHQYIDQLKTEEDLEKICIPDISHDLEETEKRQAIASDIFKDILKVNMAGVFPGFSAWDRIAAWHGVENILYDLIDRPEFLHKIIGRTTEAYLAMLDQLEEKELLGGYEREDIHCSGAYNDELPVKDKVKPEDLWTHGMAQVFSTVSPEMHYEFEIQYAKRWYSRFGLGYYGCCEPLHRKIDIVRKLSPNIRKISMSPWIDLEEGAEAINGDYVFSRKPNPAMLAGSAFDMEAVKKDLMETRKICEKYNNPVEFILKDISTVCYNPERLHKWAGIARNIVER